MSYQSINPTTGELVETFPTHTDIDAENALERATRRFASWRRTPIAERGDLLRKAADLLEGKAEEWARLMATEMGKPLAQGIAEAKKCAAACRYFADHAEAFLRSESRESDGSEAFVRFDPLGPVLAVMPWNFPFWQLFRFAAPALAAGNAILLKHASQTPRCARAIERLMLEAGFPEGVFQNLYLTPEQTARLIADERLRGVTLTGSTRAGKHVAASAGRALKPMVMELGGSDPFIVLEDADIAQAAEAGAAARCQNAGQSCIAAKRFLVHRSHLAAFSEKFVATMSAQVMGNPLETATTLGPLARQDLRETLAAQVSASIAEGARVLCGGSIPPGKGFFYPATVLDQVREGSPAAEEELFGPVAAIFPFDTDEKAVVLANSSPYGLGASIWTADPERAKRMAGDLESGAVFINGIVKSDPRLPFGGVKESGFGRELGREGMRAFVNTKTVWVR